MDNLKTKLGANYTKFFLWFNKEKVKNGNIYAYVEYDNMIIVSKEKVYETDEEKQKFFGLVKKLNIDLQKIKIENKF